MANGNGHKSITRLIALITIGVYTTALTALFVFAFIGVEGWDRLTTALLPLASGFAPLAIGKMRSRPNGNKEVYSSEK